MPLRVDVDQKGDELTKYNKPIIDGLKKALLARWAASRAAVNKSREPAGEMGKAMAS